MRREEIVASIQLKKRFCKDMNVPITLFDEPYFSQRIQILDPIHHCMEQFRRYCKELERFKNPEEYFAYYNDVKERIITTIRENQSYIEFCNKSFQAIDGFRKQNIYADTNIGRMFVSIDIKQANYSIMRMYDNSIFNEANSWEQFVSEFTNLEHIIKSKYVRNVILGACNPGKQIQAERFYMGMLSELLMKDFPQLNVYSVNVDEIIIEYKENSGYTYESLLCKVKDSSFGKYIKVEPFVLHKFKGIDGYYKSIYTNPNDKTAKRIDIKCVNGEYYHQVVKYMMNQEIFSDDLVFYEYGRLARFLEPIENPWGRIEV